MGNTSCAPSIISSTGVVKVVLKDGTVEAFTRTVKAVELMLENPRQFVCDFGDLKVGYRVPGLAADEELQRRRLYLLLPIDMLYSVLTNEEMNYLSCKACKALKNGASNNIRKIFPVVLGELCIFPWDGSTLEESFSAGNSESVEKIYSKQRSWKPALDTIIETPCAL